MMGKDMIQGCDLLCVSVDHFVERHVALSQTLFEAWRGCYPACSREKTRWYAPSVYKVILSWAVIVSIISYPSTFTTVTFVTKVLYSDFLSELDSFGGFDPQSILCDLHCNIGETLLTSSINRPHQVWPFMLICYNDHYLIILLWF